MNEGMVWFDIIAGAGIVFFIVVVLLGPFRRWLAQKIDRHGSPPRPPVVLLPPPRKSRRDEEQ